MVKRYIKRFAIALILLFVINSMFNNAIVLMTSILVFIGYCIYLRESIDKGIIIVVGEKGTTDERTAEYIDENIKKYQFCNFCDIKTLKGFKRPEFEVKPSRIVIFVRCMTNIKVANDIAYFHKSAKVTALVSEMLCDWISEFDNLDNLETITVDYEKIKIGDIPELITGGI